jgi:hypothetical protein
MEPSRAVGVLRKCNPRRTAATKGGVRMRKAVMALGALALASFLAIPTLLAQNEKSLSSGFQVGEGTPPFDVVDVSGPNKGKQLCYV